MAAAAAGVGRLEEEALRRKERLKALREKTGRKVRDVEWEVQAWRPVFCVRAGGRRPRETLVETRVRARAEHAR